MNFQFSIFKKVKIKGFTLIELLVVIAVIGLISSIILVSMKGTRGKARITTGLQFSQSINHVLGAYAVGIWDFNDQDSPSTAHDRSGYANHGTIYGATYVGGPAGGETDTPYHVLGQKQGKWALSFDGVDDYVDCGSDTSLQITGDQTYEFWIYPYNFTARRNPINKAYGGEGTMTLEISARISYYWGTCGGNCFPYQGHSSGEAIPANKWTHVVHVRDLTNNVMIWYFNGNAVSTLVPGYAAAVASSNDLWIGDGYVSPIDGLIDEVRIYERALSAAQIQQRYAESAPRYGIVLK